MKDTPTIKLFDLAKQMVDILSDMSKDELMELKLKYNIAFAQIDLKNLQKKIESRK